MSWGLRVQYDQARVGQNSRGFFGHQNVLIGLHQRLDHFQSIVRKLVENDERFDGGETIQRIDGHVQRRMQLCGGNLYSPVEWVQNAGENLNFWLEEKESEQTLLNSSFAFDRPDMTASRDSRTSRSSIRTWWTAWTGSRS